MEAPQYEQHKACLAMVTAARCLRMEKDERLRPLFRSWVDRLKIPRMTGPHAEPLLKMCVASALAFFLFGWHVHEKAILNVVAPLFLFVAFCKQSALEKIMAR